MRRRLASVSLSISWVRQFAWFAFDTDDSSSHYFHLQRQNLAAVASDGQRMLPLCGQSAIFVVTVQPSFLEAGMPSRRLAWAQYKSYTFHQLGAGVGAAVVKYLGFFMEDVADAVTTIFPNVE